MSFKGNLQSLGLFDVLQNVSQNCLTGTLTVTTKDRTRWVYFDRGKVRLVSSGEKVGLPMRDFLVQRGYVSSGAMEKAIKSRGRSRALLQDILVKNGEITNDEFVAAYCERIEEFLYELLEIKSADYEFTDGPAPKGLFDMAQKSLGLSLEIQPMLVEGARRDDEWSRIKNVVQSGREIFAKIGEAAPEEGEVDDILVELWDQLDGRTEVSELEDTLPYGRFEIHNAIHALVGLGFARPVTGSELSELALQVMQAGEKGKGRTLLEHALELERNNLELRRMLAELLEDLGESKEAAACWAVIGYQENVNQREEESLAAYEKAARLDSTDVGLLERHHEIVGRCGDTGQYEAATLQLSGRLLEHGLMERAIDAVTRAMDRPDLADRPALLEHLIGIYQRAGRPEDGLEMLVSAASKAERLGDRERAISILEIGVAAMPDQPELKTQLEDVMTSRRMRKRRFVRRMSLILSVIFVVGLAGLVLVEEIRVQRKMADPVKDLPMAILEDRARDDLIQLKGILDAHWLAPSLGNVESLVNGLADVELQRILVASQAYRFREALDRIRQVSSILGDHPVTTKLETLRSRCVRGRDFLVRFKGYLTTSDPDEPKNADAFQFYKGGRARHPRDAACARAQRLAARSPADRQPRRGGSAA